MIVSEQLKATMGAVAAIVVLIGGLMAYLHHQQWTASRTSAFMELIDGQFTSVAYYGELDPEERIRRIDGELIVDGGAANTNAVVALVTPTFDRLAGPAVHPVSSPSSSDRLYRIVFPNGDEELAFGASYPLDDDQLLFTGRLVAPYKARIYESWTTLIGGGLVVALPLAALGIWNNRRIKRQLAQISEVCAAVGEGRLAERLPSVSSGEVAVLTRLVNGMIERLQRLVGSLSDLGDSVRHEVAHGVSRIELKAARLRGLLEDGTAAGGGIEMLDEIETECRAIVASARAMLSLSSIKAGEGFAPVHVDLSETVRSVLDALSVLAEDKNVGIESDLGACVVLADPELLQIMVSNLVSNAIKFSPEGGSIAVAAGRRDTAAEVTVEDSGPGIAPADRADVFAPRRRLDRDAATPGHGYGLAITRAIVERHAGMIAIEDGAVGARFVVRLPLLDEGTALND